MTALAHQASATQKAAEWAWRVINPPKTRSLLEFAESEIVVPTGDSKGPWRSDTLPWTRCLYSAIDSGNWPTVVTTGPSQSGKTLQCFGIPTIYTIAELAENFVLGVPDEDMADKKWRTDLLPILRSSPRLRNLIPTEGPGSRGGKVKDTIQFTNSVVAAIMSRGSGDAAKAGFTARIVVVTEAADFSQGTETSQEADPLKQLRARQRSYQRRRRQLLVEGTGKIEEWLPWSMRGNEEGPIISTMSQLLTPCPHCDGFMAPEREHFVGWEDAESEDQACNEATFICPLCATALSEHDRKVANRDIRLVHYGQNVNEHGEVIGELPPTSTLWFRYSQWQNLLLTPADLAEDEWKAQQMPEGTQDRDNAERELCQFQWCLPFKSTLIDQEPLKPSIIRKRMNSLGRNRIPEDTQRITIGVDIGDWTGWWVAIAWRANGERHICGYGNFDIKRHKGDELDTRIVAGLHEFSESAVDGLFPDATIWIDGGYMPDSVAQFIRDKGTVRSNQYHFCRGRGKSVTVAGLTGLYNHPKQISNAHPKIGRQWFGQLNLERRILEYTFNADYWKVNVHEGLGSEKGAIGRITLFDAAMKNEHVKISNHFANEQLVRSWEPEKGYTEKWVRKGDNHWLDCAAMASVCGDFAGIDLLQVKPDTELNVFEEALRA